MSLFFGLDHARSAIAEWQEDFNTARPHFLSRLPDADSLCRGHHRNRVRRCTNARLRASGANAAASIRH